MKTFKKLTVYKFYGLKKKEKKKIFNKKTIKHEIKFYIILQVPCCNYSYDLQKGA